VGLTSVQRFTSSDRSWVGDHKLSVCLNPGAPASCPTTEPFVSYNFAGGGWSADLSPIPGAQWVWDTSKIADGSAAEGADFSVTGVVNVPGCASGSTLLGAIWVAADDFAEVFVNGASAGFTGSTSRAQDALRAQSTLLPMNITQFLVPGFSNVIEVHAVNGAAPLAGCQNCSYSANPAGVVFGGLIACRSLN